MKSNAPRAFEQTNLVAEQDVSLIYITEETQHGFISAGQLSSRINKKIKTPCIHIKQAQTV